MSEPLRVIYAGTPEFAATALNSILASRHQVVAVYTQPDRPAGRGRKLTASPVKAVALQNNLPVEQPASLKDDVIQAQLAAYDADVMVVAAYGLLLPESVLKIPRYGCLNIHASLLPRWRGAAPIQRAILDGDAETGITIMQMDVGLDTGAMLQKVECPISATDTAASLHDKLAALGAEAIVTVLEKVAEGALVAEQQDDSQACYAHKLSKAEASIDWTRSAQYLNRMIHAFNPWPVAFTQLDGQVLRIWDSSVDARSGDRTLSPGTVVNESAEGIQVATGDGILNLTRIQLPGKKPQDVKDFLNSRSIVGITLGR